MLILFLVYINRVFEKVLVTYLIITALFFIDNLRSIILKYLVKILAKILRQITIFILDLKQSNPIIYDRAKIKGDLFFKFYYKQFNKQIAMIEIKISSKKIKFNKKAIWWLWIQLNSWLKFTVYVNTKFWRKDIAKI